MATSEINPVYLRNSLMAIESFYSQETTGKEHDCILRSFKENGWVYLSTDSRFFASLLKRMKCIVTLGAGCGLFYKRLWQDVCIMEIYAAAKELNKQALRKENKEELQRLGYNMTGRNFYAIIETDHMSPGMLKRKALLHLSRRACISVEDFAKKLLEIHNKVTFRGVGSFYDLQTDRSQLIEEQIEEQNLSSLLNEVLSFLQQINTLFYKEELPYEETLCVGEMYFTSHRIDNDKIVNMSHLKDIFSQIQNLLQQAINNSQISEEEKIKLQDKQRQFLEFKKEFRDKYRENMGSVFFRDFL